MSRVLDGLAIDQYGKLRFAKEFRSCRRPPQRDTFFDDLHSISFEELEKKYTAPIKAPFRSRVKRKIKSIIENIHKVIVFLGG